MSIFLVLIFCQNISGSELTADRVYYQFITPSADESPVPYQANTRGIRAVGGTLLGTGIALTVIGVPVLIIFSYFKNQADNGSYTSSDTTSQAFYNLTTGFGKVLLIGGIIFGGLAAGIGILLLIIGIGILAANRSEPSLSPDFSSGEDSLSIGLKIRFR